MKSWVEGHLNNIAAINELQRVLNQGLAPRMKQMVRQMIRQMEMTGDDERLEKFHAILRDIPKLWAAYRHEPLKSRLGSNSASRSRSYGMGLAIRETLPRRALLAMKKSAASSLPSPSIHRWKSRSATTSRRPPRPAAPAGPFPLFAGLRPSGHGTPPRVAGGQ